MGHTCYSLCNEYCTEKIHLFNNFKVCIIGIVYIHIMTGMMANNHLFLLSLFLTVKLNSMRITIIYESTKQISVWIYIYHAIKTIFPKLFLC